MIRIESFVGELLRDYDHNRNGVIDLTADGRGRDERLAKKAHISEGLVADSYYEDVISWSGLLYAADRDADGKVNRRELKSYLDTYDWNGDGVIDLATRPHPEKRSLWQKIVDLFTDPVEQDEFYKKHREERVDRIPLTVIQRKAPQVDTEVRYTEPDASAS